MRALQFEDYVGARPLVWRCGGKPRDETGAGAGQRAVGGRFLAVKPNRQNENAHVIEFLRPHGGEHRRFDERLAPQHRANACLVLPQLVKLRVVLVFFLQQGVL